MRPLSRVWYLSRTLLWISNDHGQVSRNEKHRPPNPPPNRSEKNIRRSTLDLITAAVETIIPSAIVIEGDLSYFPIDMIKQSGYRGDDCSDGLELENMTMNRGDF